ncbi:hypothetical protein BHYA_0258g00140 [Botrytis hyacinthi]|uniref:Uncharacterized protein n=1 Tax=Botrytis hyacinthi TaxID=278943 RepID=A0A4Z1G8H9_9HELO|nr:hypothetical protein BHYA_0258g00140 [Botrytis hyacinthi]
MSTTSLDLDLSLGLGEPIICLNTSCNYPFGRICGDCSNELDSRAQAQSQSKSKPNFNNRVTKTPTPLSRSTTVQSRSHDIPTRVVDIIEDLQEIFAFIPAAAAVPSVAPAIPPPPSKLTMQSLRILDATPTPLQLLSFPHPLPPFSNLPSASASPSTCNSSDSTPAPLNSSNLSILNTWLNDIVLRTLGGQVLAPAFTGGAEEGDELEDMCPYCDSSMGEGAWRELHLINCRYAHVEAERLEIAKGKVLERGVSGK